ncbi:hypothetical protein BYT27DRAFT_7203495 [Phlegmacium glaucopus]|nr:hypothetical protein BYT27DRAFT_7203495 [Phlegmacium glaucopus]
MSSERTPKRHRIDEVTPSFRRKLFHSSDSPAPSSMDVDSSSDNYTATTYASNFPISMAPVVSVDHASATVTSTVARGISPPIPVPVSAPISAPISAVTRQSGISGPAPYTHMLPNIPISPSSPNALLQNNPSVSGLFSNAQNTLISGGTFVNYENYCNLPANTGEAQTKIPIRQKPNSSPLFTGQEDVLDKLEKLFPHRANSSLMLRRCCLLWGMGGIGKTQICLKFTEKESDRCIFSHCHSQHWINFLL